MSAVPKARWSTIYTLTETHPGSEGTRGAVDLPIAREAATGLPFLPDTSLKGVARAAVDPEQAGNNLTTRLFGSPLGDVEEDTHTTPGGLSVLQGSLLLYPLRALNRMYVYATAPFLLERLDRVARSVGIAPPWSGEKADLLDSLLADADGDKTLVSSKDLDGPLFVERVLRTGSHSAPLETLAGRLGDWLPDSEKRLKERIANSLVVLPDDLFALLLETAPPVRARIKLNSRGTTENLAGDAGNLWYEERLPADVLFWTLIIPRPVGDVTDDDLDQLHTSVKVVQIGGGATTGHGQCLWHVGGRDGR